jgi:hypothetical protein
MRAIAVTNTAMRTRRSSTKERFSERVVVTMTVAYSAADRNSFRRASAFVGHSEGEDAPGTFGFRDVPYALEDVAVRGMIAPPSPPSKQCAALRQSRT